MPAVVPGSPQEVSLNGTKLHSSTGASPVPAPIGIAPLLAFPAGKWLMRASALLEIPQIKTSMKNSVLD
jgi:hypothetical protein